MAPEERSEAMDIAAPGDEHAKRERSGACACVCQLRIHAKHHMDSNVAPGKLFLYHPCPHLSAIC